MASVTNRSRTVSSLAKNTFPRTRLLCKPPKGCRSGLCLHKQQSVLGPPIHISGSLFGVCWCAAGDDKTVVPAEWMIKKMESDDELVRFLELVLQGYFESSFGGMFQGDHSRYVKTFMRQKLEQEVERLKEKYKPRDSKHAESLCLIATENGSEEVAGGCEVCVSESLSGICPVGVPVADKDGFYIQNLIVRPDLRRRGIAMSLIDALLELISELGGSAVYANVEAQNEGAVAFYEKRNFEVVKTVKELDPAANLGRVLLLKLDLRKRE